MGLASEALYDHCVKAFAYMQSNANMTDDGAIWLGSGTQLITKQLKLSQSYYTNVFGALQEMGCIMQVRRGGGGTPSAWRLLEQPNEDQWIQYKNSGKAGVRPDPQFVGANLTDLKTRVSKLEADVSKLTQLIIAHFTPKDSE